MLTDGRDGGDDLSELQLVQDGGLTSGIKTNHQNTYMDHTKIKSRRSAAEIRWVGFEVYHAEGIADVRISRLPNRLLKSFDMLRPG